MQVSPNIRNFPSLQTIQSYFSFFFQITVRSLNTRPRRAVLYVPGNDDKKIAKSLNLKVDCVALDCEDGVAISRKVST